MQMMQDEIEKHEYLKRDCDYSIIIKPGAFISEPIPFTEWQQEKIGQVKKVIESLNHLFGAFHYYYGEPGVPSDIEGLYYVAHRYGELYASLLEWIIDVRSTNASEIYSQVIQVLSELPLKVIEQLKAYPETSMRLIRETESKIAAGSIEKETNIDLTLHVSIDNSVLARLHEEINELQDNLLN